MKHHGTRVKMPRLLRDGAIAGSSASLTSALALTIAGRVCGCGPYAPINAPSHWLWGRSSHNARELSLRHTLPGFVIHHASAVFWGLVYVGGVGTRPRSALGLTAGAATVSALACLVDYRLAPRGLRPGFERHLGRPALAGVYAALAAGLALPAVLGRRPAN